jgi:hypothetical protein
MFTLTFEIVIFIAAFILGWLEGPRLWTAIKVLAGKEVAFVETKIHAPTGPTGAH